MVLFYEDEKKQKQPLTKARRRLRLAFRIVLILGAMFGLSLVFMNVMGGESDSLRAGVQDYLRGATGLQAEIGRFDGVTFFPEAGISAGDIVFRPDAGAAPVATIGSLDFVMGFWDVFFRRGRLRVLEVKDAHIDAGMITARALDITRIGIDMNGESAGVARLSAAGAYGGAPFLMTVAMDTRSRGAGRQDFSRPESSTISVDFPFLKTEGVMSRARGGGLQFDFGSIGKPEGIAKGRVLLKRGYDGTFLSLDLSSSAGGDKAVAALEEIYCAFKPPGRALWEGIKIEAITVDGQSQKVSGECPGTAVKP